MRQGLLSWGRYPATPQRARPVYWRHSIGQALDAAAKPTLPFGNGRAYGDACHAGSGEVLHMRATDRVIAADWQGGRLHAEAGITLAEILELCVPHGWFLPVVPGTGLATLGGAIANDVHGKNHHRRGTFGNHILSLELVRSDRPRLTCSRSENADLFAATVGGLGLTGVIASAEIQLMPIRSGAMNTITQRFDRLEDFFALSSRLDLIHEYGVAWVDCMASGRHRGRGIYIAADHAGPGVEVRASRLQLSVPFTPPFALINGFSSRAFNPVHWRLAPARAKHAVIHYSPYFHPLDRVLSWNRLYGRKGFQQFQCALPDSTAEAGIGDILDAVSVSGLASFLTVLKRFGDSLSPGLLSFPIKGVTLAIDFAQADRPERTLFPVLDKIVHRAGGRLYPAKDAHMSAAHFQGAYPHWQQVERMRDPAINSCLWQRLTR
jgi:FAD/FMN-containing dehydrogenase